MPMTKPGKFDSQGAWDGFRGEMWQEEINVRDFIQKNYTPYDGDESFLAGPTESTTKLWNEVQKLQKMEREKGGVLECETEVVSGLTAYGPGYINEEMKVAAVYALADMVGDKLSPEFVIPSAVDPPVAPAVAKAVAKAAIESGVARAKNVTPEMVAENCRKMMTFDK